MFTERDKARFWVKVKQKVQCWEWTGCLNKNGYGTFNLKEETLVHRISYQIFHGKLEKNIQVLHKCDNPKCVNPDHLFVGTHSDNMKDKVSKGRSRHFGRRSLYYGVTWRNDSQKWRSYIMLNRKMKHLGSHLTEIEAAKNYDKIAFSVYGIADKLNFPLDWMPLPNPPKD
jgi:hypothetical protein